MTYEEKQEVVKDLQYKVNGTICALIAIRNVARSVGREDSYPMFKDPTVQSLIAAYEQLQSVRGW